LPTTDIQLRLLKCETFLEQNFPEYKVGMLEVAEGVIDPEDRYLYLRSALLNLADMKDHSGMYRNGELPVDFATFMKSKEYMNWTDVIWPEVMKCASELNSGRYVEGVLTGGIGVAKTTIALWTMAYQLYVLSCFQNPQKVYGISSSDEIVFIIQSIAGKQAKEVGYDRLRAMIEEAPYFKNKFRFDKDLMSQMVFPNRIKIMPLSGATTAAIGQNVFGGLLDEVNFMAYVEDSKASKDGGSFDQAQELYLAIKRRRQSRFMVQGRVPGMLCLVSSKRYPGEFTERKIKEADEERAKHGLSSIYVYDKKVWEVKLKESFMPDTFRVFQGDQKRKPRILRKGEKLGEEDEASLVLEVPMDYYTDFETDLLDALRDIGGVSTLALHPYILDIEKIYAGFGKSRSILTVEECDFQDTLVSVYPKRILNKQSKRFVHIDLAVSGDSAGVACGYVSHFVKQSRSKNEVEILPHFVFDFVLRVSPPRSGEIIFSRIRELLYRVRELGCPITWVTLDSFQSVDTRQILASKGFITGTKSVDTENKPYDILKSAILDGRFSAPEHDVAPRELSRLEKVPKTNKIDHPPNGSKDCSDGMAGVVYGLFVQREIWFDHGIDPMTAEKAVSTYVKKSA
jgi:hypothetical protein